MPTACAWRRSTRIGTAGSPPRTTALSYAMLQLSASILNVHAKDHAALASRTIVDRHLRVQLPVLAARFIGQARTAVHSQPLGPDMAGVPKSSTRDTSIGPKRPRHVEKRNVPVTKRLEIRQVGHLSTQVAAASPPHSRVRPRVSPTARWRCAGLRPAEIPGSGHCAAWLEHGSDFRRAVPPGSPFHQRAASFTWPGANSTAIKRSNDTSTVWLLSLAIQVMCVNWNAPASGRTTSGMWPANSSPFSSSNRSSCRSVANARKNSWSRACGSAGGWKTMARMAERGRRVSCQSRPTTTTASASMLKMSVDEHTAIHHDNVRVPDCDRHRHPMSRDHPWPQIAVLRPPRTRLLPHPSRR